MTFVPDGPMMADLQKIADGLGWWAGGMLVFPTMLAGLPIGFIGQDADATFELFSPEGDRLLHRTDARLGRSYAVGLYYNHGRTLGSLVGRMAAQFTGEVDGRIDAIRAGEEWK